MKIVFQRVQYAQVEINKEIVGQINQGALLFVGFEPEDNLIDLDWAAKKVAALRVFSDADNKMNLSINDVNGQFLVVSQFTLHASTKKGSRPSFIKSAKPEIAIPLYEQFIQKLQNNSKNLIETGEFGADMKVQLCNDGPVTILIDTKNKE